MPYNLPKNPDSAGFGVYIHWPFCASKCPYCDFNSHVRAGGVDEGRFLAAYVAELRFLRDLIGPRTVSSIFIGGGTPSLMQAETVGGLLDAVAAVWTIETDAEITLEANPNSVEAKRFAGYRAAGINRVSVGVQALDGAALRRLGRLHTVDEALAALDVARRTFGKFSFDLIYARPGQDPRAWRDELRRAMDIGADHMSLYQLTIEPGTAFGDLFAIGKFPVLADERAEDMFEITQDLTEAGGLPAYEVSNHARPGSECRHNLLYWRYGEYAGVGPGAHGRLVCDGGRIVTTMIKQPEAWLAAVDARQAGFCERVQLSPAEQVDEALLMGLRLREGMDLGRLAQLGGVRPAAPTLERLAALGLVALSGDGQRLRVGDRGRFVLNEVVLQLSATLEPIAGACDMRTMDRTENPS